MKLDPRLLAPLLCLVPSLCADDALALDPVSVTAQKRAESIESVPVPVNAFTAESLEVLGIQRLDQLSLFVPGLTVQLQSPNNPGINLRGLTTDSGDPRSESRVSVYQDGISINRSRGTSVALFDMERIEVLKGPQGTLFGRGAQIGAISLIQCKPTPFQSGSVTVGAGDWGQRRAEGVLNTPLVGDTLIARVAVLSTKHEGFVQNTADGSRLNGEETFATRASLRYAVPGTTVDLIYNFQHDTPPGVAFLSGVIPGRDGRIDTQDKGEFNRGSALGVDRTIHGLTLLAENALSPSWKVISTSGWRQYKAVECFDADGSRLRLFEADEDSRGRQVSQEFRVQYDAGGVFTGFAGANVFHEEARRTAVAFTDERTLAAWFLCSAPYNVPLFSSNGDPFVGLTRHPKTGATLASDHQEGYLETGGTTATELFADGTWKMLRRLYLTLGLRVTHERIDSGYDVGISNPAGAFPLSSSSIPNDLFTPTNGLIQASTKADSWVGRAVLRYEFAKEANAYASVSRGRRPPSLLIAAGPTINLMREESVLNYETGVKGTAWGRRLSYEGSMFWYSYDHFQTDVADFSNPGRTLQRDAGQATGKGFETSIKARLLSNLSVFGNYAYTDARFDDCDASGRVQEYAGNTFRLTPKHAVSLGATLRAQAGHLGELRVTPSYAWRSLVYFEDDNHQFSDTLKQPPLALVNLRVELRLPGGHWELGAYVTNLFDKRSYVDAGNSGANFGDPTFVPGARRMIGFEITTNF